MSATALSAKRGSPSRPDSAGPVKIVIERLPRQGAEERLRVWAEQFVAEASRAPGHEGGSVLSGRGGPHLILLRFASASALEAWQRSPGYESLLREAEAVSTRWRRVAGSIGPGDMVHSARQADAHEASAQMEDGAGHLARAPPHGDRPRLYLCAAATAVSAQRFGVDGHSSCDADVGDHAARDASAVRLAVPWGEYVIRRVLLAIVILPMVTWRAFSNPA